MSKTHQVISALLGSCVLSLQPTSAVASDGKTFPGAFCVEGGDADPEVMYDQENGAAAENTNPSYAATYICPIVRDHMSDEATLSGTVMVDDQHASKSVKCAFFSIASNGLAGLKGDTDSTLDIGRGPEALHPGSLSASYTFENGYYVLLCEIPDAESTGRSSIMGYRTSEG